MTISYLFGLALKGKRYIFLGLFLLLAAGLALHLSGFGGNLSNMSVKKDFKVNMPSGIALKNSFRAAVLGNADFHPVLKVAIPPKARLAGLLSPFGDGLDRDLLECFAQDYGFALQYSEVNSFAEANEMLKQGKVDLAAGFPGSLDNAYAGMLTSSPAYDKVTPMLLKVGKTPKNTTPELMVSDPTLADAVPQKDNTMVLETEPLSDDVAELVSYLEAGQTGYALVDSVSVGMLRPLFPRLNVSAQNVGGSASHHWVWRDDESFVALSLQNFWDDRSTKRYIEDLKENYQGFMPKSQKRKETIALINGLEQELIQYHEAIADAAREYNLDPLLLTAVMFQESHFINNTDSKNGKGLMQLTRSTAASLGVNPADPYSNIRGGAKYLRTIFDSLENENMDYWDRWFVTLAAYNQGPGHMTDALKIATSKNSKTSWRSVKEAYLALEQNPSKRGKVRGKHVVKYVQNIRYYYYVLNGLVVLDRPEAQHLTPLLAKASRPIGAGS